MFQVREHYLNFTPKIKEPEQDIKVFLVQEPYPESKIGRRAGQGLYVGRIQADDTTPLFRQQITSFLNRIPEDVAVGIISEHPGNQISMDLFQEQADQRGQIIIARLGHYHRTSGETTNSIAVISPGHDPILVDQLSFSEEDYQYYARGKLNPGSEINVFYTPFGNMGVISCHDYTNADIIKKFSEYDIEILVVSSFNPATRLFMQYAMADIHRFSCFVIISNIANYGGSGVFAPFRYNGPKKASMTLGGAIAYTQGASSAFLEVDLPLADLRKLRHRGVTVSDSDGARCPWTPIQPSEEFLSAGLPEYKKGLDQPDHLAEIDLEACGYRFAGSLNAVNIGVAQLKCLEDEDYFNHYYCISCSPKAPLFVKQIREHLEFLGERLDMSGQKLDFLVFPEVFIPLSLEDDLRDFARKFNTIIIAGVEYDPQPENLESPALAHGANRCFIYVPTISGEVERFRYDKMTRSQYDALLPPGPDGEQAHFTMDRGSQLLRFSCGDQFTFGVLICYDYSHFDIVHRINRDSSQQIPLDLLCIIASNHDSQLYERCCIADSHRYYQYIVMANVSQYGGSGVFGPIRTPGLRQTLLSAGVGSEAIIVGSVDIKGLQAARAASLTDAESSFQHKPGIFQMMRNPS